MSNGTCNQWLSTAVIRTASAEVARTSIGYCSVEAILEELAALIRRKRTELDEVGNKSMDKITTRVCTAAVQAIRQVMPLGNEVRVYALFEDFLAKKTMHTPFPDAYTAEREMMYGRQKQVAPLAPAVEFGEFLYAHNEHTGENLSSRRCTQLMLQKGFSSQKICGTVHYVGIRLRTIRDPLPMLLHECRIDPPNNIKRIGHVLTMATRPLIFGPPDDRERVIAWLGQHYIECDPAEHLIEACLLFDEFTAFDEADRLQRAKDQASKESSDDARTSNAVPNDDTLAMRCRPKTPSDDDTLSKSLAMCCRLKESSDRARVSKEFFETYLPVYLFDSFPDELRWTHGGEPMPGHLSTSTSHAGMVLPDELRRMHGGEPRHLSIDISNVGMVLPVGLGRRWAPLKRRAQKESSACLAGVH